MCQFGEFLVVMMLIEYRTVQARILNFSPDKYLPVYHRNKNRDNWQIISKTASGYFPKQPLMKSNSTSQTQIDEKTY